MANFLQDIQEALMSEQVEFVQFNNLMDHFNWKSSKYVTDIRNTTIEIGKLYTWEEAKPLLDYEYDDGYGSMDCHDIYIWTPQSVLYINEYDGSTRPILVPRHPVPRK